MEQKTTLTKVSMGVFRAAIITMVLLFIYTIIGTLKDVSNQFASVYLLIATCLSVVYGAIYAARKNNRNGWMVGILVAALYMLLLFFIKGVFFSSPLEMGDLLRLVIAVAVGALSGMLGINI